MSVTLMLPHRAKLIAAALSVLLAGAAALVLATPAAAAEWHAYSGDVFPGHAYGLQVPAKAESFEIEWSGPANASASLAIYDPSGARVGHYALSDALTAAVVASPAEGRYVLYVYELTGGALNLRVNAATAPTHLDLQKLPLVREDVAVSSSERPASLDKAIAANLKSPAVFLTLLYEGSAEALDATVSSAKGPALTISGETGTAFSPGVYSALSGQRRLDAANLDGTAYTVEVHARSFEGTLFLTTLAVDFNTPLPDAPVAKTPRAPDASTPPTPPTAPWNETGGAAFAFGEGKAYAFLANAGELLLADPMVGDKAGRDNGSTYDVHDAVSIYTPDDKLLAYVVLEHEAMNATVKLPVDGEYVAYVHQARDGVVLAKLRNAAAVPALRELALTEETFDFQSGGLLGQSGATFDLDRAPVSVTLAPRDGNHPDAFVDAWVENDAGTVVSYGETLGGTPFGHWGWSAMEPENFRAGEHRFGAHGVLGQDMTLTVISYLRHAAKVATHDAEHVPDAGHDLLPMVPPMPALERLPVPAIPGLYG